MKFIFLFLLFLIIALNMIMIIYNNNNSIIIILFVVSIIIIIINAVIGWLDFRNMWQINQTVHAVFDTWFPESLLFLVFRGVAGCSSVLVFIVFADAKLKLFNHQLKGTKKWDLTPRFGCRHSRRCQW